MIYLRFILLSLLLCWLAWAVGPRCDQAPNLFCAQGGNGVLDVVALGAKADGSTDNASVFTTIAATADANPGSTLYFPDGTYVYSGGLTFTQPVTLTGGHGAVLNYTGTGFAVKF